MDIRGHFSGYSLLLSYIQLFLFLFFLPSFNKCTYRYKCEALESQKFRWRFWSFVQSQSGLKQVTLYLHDQIEGTPLDLKYLKNTQVLRVLRKYHLHQPSGKLNCSSIRASFFESRYKLQMTITNKHPVIVNLDQVEKRRKFGELGQHGYVWGWQAQGSRYNVSNESSQLVFTKWLGKINM